MRRSRGRRAARVAVGTALMVTSLVVASPTVSEAQSSWTCTPIDPAQPVPSDPCLRATVADGNAVTIEWRVANSSSLVYVMDDQGPHHTDLGFKPADCISGSVVGCQTTTTVAAGGTYRWRLAVTNGAGQRTTVPTTVSVPGPTPPTVTGGGHVDVLAPASRVITWSHAPTPGVHDEWVEVQLPGFTPPVRDDDLSGAGATYTVAQSTLSAPGEVNVGVRYCTQALSTSTPLCSATADVGFQVGPARFVGDHRIHVESGADLTVGLTQDSGTIRLLASDTLVPPNAGWGGARIASTSAATYTIDDTLLTPGHHTIQLISCEGLTTCSNRADATKPTGAGTVHVVPGAWGAANLYSAGATIATVSLSGGGTQTITAPKTGHVYFLVPDGSAVTSTTLVAFVITADVDVLHVEVDDPADWTVDRSWTADFSSGTSRDVLGGGGALDVDYASDGSIWQIAEFATSVERVTPGGTVESLTAPLHRKDLTPSDGSSTFAPVRPFAMPFGSTTDTTAVSVLGERVVEIDGEVWFTQGGKLLHNGTAQNHSRILRFDPTVTDNPYTEWHDGLCAVHLPGDNNQAVGLTAASGRIWVGEYGDRSIASFDPDTVPCTNGLDYENPTAVAAALPASCTGAQTPEVDGCVAHIAMPWLVQVAHLEADPVDGSVWFTDPGGNVLGHVVDPLGSATVESHWLPAPAESIDGSISLALFKSYPWAIRVTDDAVYFGEYADKDIVRFDKANETFDELHVPYPNRQIRLHSIDIDPETDRLWFTLANETHAPRDTAAGRIGYVDLAGWEAHLADPVANPTFAAVTYSGLEVVNSTGPLSGKHQAFRGIAVNPDNGKVALATMFREQITELTPKTTFRP